LSGKGKGSTVRLKLAEISGSAIDWEGAVMTKTHHLLDRSIILYTVALAGLLVLGGQNALACGNGKLLFQDKFQTVDPRWQMAAVDPTRSVGADGLSYTLAPNSAVSAINQTSLYDDYELCAHMTMKYPDEKSNAHAGLRFWQTTVIIIMAFLFLLEMEPMLYIEFRKARSCHRSLGENRHRQLIKGATW
jgi:hypothetical protein